MTVEMDVDGVPKTVELPPLGAMPTKMGLSLWFGRVERELDQLESDIGSQSGFFVFKSHTYSKAELREHRSFRLVEALVDQIGYNVSLWDKEGRLTGPERSLYIKSRNTVEAKTSELRRRIAARKDTVFESITNLIRYIMDKLPDLVETLLVGAGRAIGLLPPNNHRRIRHQLDSEWED